MAAPPPPSPSFDLPDPVLAVLPTDPFEQLDVARKITSIALATRVSKLESEVSRLRHSLSEKDDLIHDLRARVDAFDTNLGGVSDQLAAAREEKEILLNENAALSNTVKKLNRDVSKLEIFKKTLMQSLEEEEEGSQVGASRGISKQITSTAKLSTGSFEEDDDSLPHPKSSAQSQFSKTGSSVSEDSSYHEVDAPRQAMPHSYRLASQSSTPRLTPPGSPPSLSAGGSPKRLSQPVSPRRHSISFSTTRNTFDERRSLVSSLPPSQHSPMTSPFGTGPQTGRTRVDGKEFFRQVRRRLSYEQFSAFLTNVKELNAHKQTREETLRKADDIFGPDNRDLYSIFEGLITHTLH